MVTDIAEAVQEAKNVRLGRALLISVLGVFWLAGWLAGHLWVGMVMAAFAIRRGWRDAVGYQPPPQPPQPPAGQVR